MPPPQADLGPFLGDIRPKKVPRAVDHEIAALAGRQYGVISLLQLRALGLGWDGVKRRVAAGRLHRVHQGVYAVGHRALTTHGRFMAAVLACGPDALLSHHAGGQLLGILKRGRAAIDVTVPGRSRHGRPGIAVHRVRGLHPGDRAKHEGIPVTSIGRTLLDLAVLLTPRELARAAEAAERNQLLDLDSLIALLERTRGHRGMKALARLVDGYTAAPPTRSWLERRFVELCEEARLPPPRLNVRVAGYEVDAHWPDHRLCVELDSRTYHATLAAFEIDRAKDTALTLAGQRPVRVTHRRLAARPGQVMSEMRQLINRP